MTNKIKRNNRKIIKGSLIAIIILCIIAIPIIVNIMNPEVAKNVHIAQLKRMYADQEYEAMIGENGYATLQEAIEAANENEEITLLSEVTLNVELTISKSITIDLSGCTMYVPKIINNSNGLILKNGEIYATGDAAIENNGNLSLDKLYVNNIKSTGYGINNKVTLYLDEGVEILAENPIGGIINNIREDYVVRISKYSTTVKQAKVISIAETTDEETITCQNILYSTIYDALTAIRNMTGRVEIKLLKNSISSVSSKNSIKIQENQNIKLNLNNKALTILSQHSTEDEDMGSKTTGYYMGIINKGILSIDNGTLNEGKLGYAVGNLGSLTINNVTFNKKIGILSGQMTIKGEVNCSQGISLHGGTTKIQGTVNANEIKNGKDSSSDVISTLKIDGATINSIINNYSSLTIENSIINKGIINYNSRQVENTYIKESTVTADISSDGPLTLENSTLNGNIVTNEYTKATDLAKLTILSGIVNGNITQYGEVILGKEDSTDENRPVINGSLQLCGKKFLMNNAEITVTDTNAVNLYPIKGKLEAVVKDGRIESVDASGVGSLSAIDVDCSAAYWDDSDRVDESPEIRIERGQVIAPIDGFGIRIVDANRNIDAYVTVGVDDKIIDYENPYIQGKVTYSTSDTGSNIGDWKIYDGKIVSPVEFSERVIGLFDYSGENEEFYSENYSVVNEQKDGKYILTIKDTKPPQNIAVEVMHNECTFDSIKLKVSAEDTGIGLDKYIVYYRKVIQAESELEVEADWIESEDGANYITITNLEQGMAYNFDVKLFDKAGNSKTSTSSISGQTTGGIDSVSLDSKALSLEVEETHTLIATINPSGARNQSLNWESSDDTVATVQDGVVTAVSPGTTTITVTTVDSGRTDTCEVTVKGEIVSVEGVTLDKQTLTLEEGKTEQLNATINPNNATNKNVTWSTSDASKATVDQEGNVTGISEGTATITVTTEDGSKTATCEVEVTPASIPVVEVTGVELNKTSIELVRGVTEKLIATVKPDDATNKNVTWSTSNSSIATVDREGNVTAVGIGEATITVTTVYGEKTAECEVVVVEPIPPTVSVTGVELNKTTLTIEEGDVEQLTATVKPSGATNKDVLWSSSDDGIVTVDHSGKITAKSAGTARITVTTVDGEKTATCQVTVNPKVIPVTGVELNKTTLSLDEGESETLTATITPNNATDKTVLWTTSNGNVATVDNGKVTAVSAGTATITVTTVDGNKTATCEVTVAEKIVPVTGVILNKSTLNLIEGNSETLTAAITPSEATNQAVTWSTSDAEIATVDQTGKVTAVSAGTATITVTTEDGSKTATCEVTVTQKVVNVTGITLDKTSLILETGNTEKITAILTPAEATNKEVTWSTSNDKVATVDQNGNVTAVGAGTATITATTVDGGKTASCEIEVAKPSEPIVEVTGVELNKTSITLEKGKTEKLIATVKPTNATNKNVTWTTSNDNVATVDQDGNVIAVGAGTATITVVTSYGGKTATCEITVTEKQEEQIVELSKISLNKTILNLTKGKSEKLELTITPSNAEIQDIVWLSSNSSIATVDQNGNVTGVKEGTTYVSVTVTGKSGKSMSVNCGVVVGNIESNQNVNLQSISIDKTEISLYKDESSSIKLTINPENASIDTIIYTSSNTDVATVNSNGQITAVGYGISTITVVVKDKNGNVLAKECKVTVNRKTTDKEDDNDNKKDEEDDNTQKDPTIMDGILPNTGFGIGVLITSVGLIVYGIVMLIKYRKMKDIK